MDARARLARSLAPGLVLVAIAAVYAPTLGFGFVRWDDPIHVTANPLVTAPRSVAWTDHLTTPGLGYPLPVTVFTYRVEKAIFGLDHPGAFHATNVLLHLLACALAYRLGRRIGLGVPGAALAMVLFGLHPIGAEPVSWISGRKDLLALVFSLGAVLYALHDDPETARERRIGSLVLFTLALLSKPVAAYVPIVIIVFRVMLPSARERPRLREWVGIAAPYVVLVVLVAAFAVRGQIGVGALEAKPFGLYLRDLVYALGFHLGLLFFLHEPRAKYLPPYPSPFDPRVDLVPVVFAVACALALRGLSRDRRRTAGLGLVWAFASYLPNSNLLPLTRFLADSYVYAPLVGLGWFAGALFDALLERNAAYRKVLARAFPATVAALLGLMTIASASRYRDSVALWTHVFELYPDYRICQNLATSYYERGRPDQVLASTDVCIERFGTTHFAKNRAIALFRLGRIDEAESWFDRAVAHRTEQGLGEDAVITHYRGRIDATRAAGAGVRSSNSTIPGEIPSGVGEP